MKKQLSVLLLLGSFGFISAMEEGGDGQASYSRSSSGGSFAGCSDDDQKSLEELANKNVLLQRKYDLLLQAAAAKKVADLHGLNDEFDELNSPRCTQALRQIVESKMACDTYSERLSKLLINMGGNQEMVRKFWICDVDQEPVADSFAIPDSPELEAFYSQLKGVTPLMSKKGLMALVLAAATGYGVRTVQKK